MEILKTKVLELESLNGNFFRDRKVVAVLGFFDGVHLGHLKIIGECLNRAGVIGGCSLAFTFDAPPANIINRKLDKKLITSFSDKIRLLKGTGLDYIVVAKFNRKFSGLDPGQFCRDVLEKKLNAAEIFIGKGFKFGKNSSGDVNFLRNYFKGSNVNINEIEILKLNGMAVSSTAIRNYYNLGDVDNVNKFLGRIPFIKGTVIHGDSRGRLLGFPTANIDVFEKYVMFKDGVYAGFVRLLSARKNRLMPSVVNIGNNPTFDGKRKWAESYILDFREDIYGKRIEVSFLKRLRDEKTFSDRDELVRQIKSDIENAKQFFKNFSEIYKL